jgi:hypothetical protein
MANGTTEVAGARQWGIEHPQRTLWTGLNAAITYLTEIRNKATDPCNQEKRQSARHPCRKTWPEADVTEQLEPRRRWEFQWKEVSGAIEGPIRIPSASLLCFFNVLAPHSIPSKSLKFQSVLFSTPTRFRQPYILEYV